MARTSAGQRRSSYSDLPTRRRTLSSRASQRNSSSCARHHRLHRPANPAPLQIAHAFPPRLSAHHGPSMRHCAPQRQRGVADRCWTRQAKYMIRLVSLSLRDSRLYECIGSRCSRSRFCPLALEATVRGCGNRCSSLTIACPRCPSTSI